MIFFLLLSILFGSSIAQVPLEHDTTLGEYYPFAVHLPASETAQTGKVPVNVFLHGAGSYGDAGELDTKTLWNGAGKLLLQYYSGNVTPASTLAAESFLTVLPLAPNQTQAGVVPEWNDDGVFNVVQRVFDTYPQVDRTRVYISGYSLGARAAWKLLVERPDLWAAAAISAGEPSNETDWSKLLNIPIRHYVGTEDYEGSSNVGKGETIQSLIEQAGGKLCELVQIPGPEPLPAHNQMAIAPFTEDMFNFLLNNTKTVVPPSSNSSVTTGSQNINGSNTSSHPGHDNGAPPSSRSTILLMACFAGALCLLL